MNMEDGLPGIGAAVEDNPVPRLENTLKLSNLTSGKGNSGKQPRITGSKLPQVPIPLPWHNKHMNLRLRPNIPKRKGQVILVHDVSRDLPSNDPLEESLILTHDQHPSDSKPPHQTDTERQPRGVRGLAPGWGSGGLTPREHNERKAAHDRSEARKGAAER